MPAESTMDLVAFGVFLGIWIGYQLLIDGRFRRSDSINALMFPLRREWMRQLLVRITILSLDAGRPYHAQRGILRVATVLVLAGLIGVLGSADQIHAAFSNISILVGGGQRNFEWKIALLIAIFVYAFFKFTWALRQFNYFCAVIGSAPDARQDSVDIGEYSECMAALSAMPSAS